MEARILWSKFRRGIATGFAKATSLLVLLPALLLVGAAPVETSKTFRFRLSGDPETLDWNRAHTTEETYLLMNLMEGLLEIDQDLKVQPRLAEKYAISPDGKTYTFTLRQGVAWQDGVPLKAGDFVAGWKRLISPFTAASYAYLLFDVVGAKDFYDGKLKDFEQVGVKALDDRRLEVRLKQPLAHWIYLPSFWPLFPIRKDVIDKHGASWASPGKMVTLGPYVLDSRELGDRVILAPNPRYWGKRGNLERIEAQVIHEDSTALTLFEAGRLDFMKDIPPLDFKRLENKPEIRFFPYLSTHYLGFALSKYPASLPAVRRAVALAIDRKELVKALGGRLTPANSFVPPQVAGHRPGKGIEYDPLRAVSTLRMSGVDPASLKLEMLIQTSDRSRMIGEIVQAQLQKNLGISVTLQPYEHKTFRAQIDLQAFPIFQMQWAADYPDAENFLSLFRGDSGNNRFGWRNARFESLLDEAKSSSDPRVRSKKYQEADSILIEKDVVVIPLYYSTLSSLVSRRSGNFVLSPLNYLFLRNVSVQ